MTCFMTSTLDRVEDKLPTGPRQIFRLQRSAAEAGYQLTRAGVGIVTTAFRPVTKQASTSASTATGQARSAVSRTIETARNGVSEVVGQTKAQAERTVDAVEDAAQETIERADDVVDSISDAALEELTKDELYDLAQEADVPGRSSMSKDELVDALRS